MKKWLIRLTKIEIVLLFLVILAGSVVRMTGSGMGCPDWPKCFGYIIPPTEQSQLEWTPNREFKKGQIIIVNQSLQVAQSDFTTGATFNQSHWEPYTKHDYALFNPFHTWVEYINRLFGALSGLPMLALVFLSLFYIRKNWRYFVLSTAGLFMLGFEAWLGKLVVDGNLIPGSITIHMMGALLLVALMLILRGLLIKEQFAPVQMTSKFKVLLLVALLFTLIQTVLGTQVREQIDHLNEAGMARSSWIENLNWQFYVHRTFSLAILGLNVWLWRNNTQYQRGVKEMWPVLLLIIIEIGLGVFLNYLDVPKFAQPTHLLLGTLLFAFQLYAVIRVFLSPVQKKVIPHTAHP
jgi:cytochrome c oxidase assembly protein subunit 15